MAADPRSISPHGQPDAQAWQRAAYKPRRLTEPRAEKKACSSASPLLARLEFSMDFLFRLRPLVKSFYRWKLHSRWEGYSPTMLG